MKKIEGTKTIFEDELFVEKLFKSFKWIGLGIIIINVLLVRFFIWYLDV